MEVLVETRTLRRFSNIASRRDVGRRSLSILDAVEPAFVGLFGNQIETELLADNTSEKSAHRMLLPMSGAAIVVPAGVRSIAMIRACLVSGRIAVFEDDGANRMRVLDLLVDREVERTAAFGLDLGLVMGSSEVRATPSAAPPQPRRANHPAGRDPMGRLGRTPAGTATLRSRTKASHFCANSRWRG